MLENASNQPSKFRTKYWFKTNRESRGGYTIGSDIKFKTIMLKSIKFKTIMLKSTLCDYADSYILVKGAITIIEERGNDAEKQANERNKKVIFKHCAQFTKCSRY